MKIVKDRRLNTQKGGGRIQIMEVTNQIPYKSCSLHVLSNLVPLKDPTELVVS